MRLLFSFAAIVCATLVGCTPEPKSKVEYEIFPAEIIVLKPGETKDVKVTRKGQDLKDTDLAITSSEPKVTAEGGKFKGDAKESTVTVKAAADAPEKEHTLTLKAGDVTKTVKVKVEKAGS